MGNRWHIHLFGGGETYKETSMCTNILSTNSIFHCYPSSRSEVNVTPYYRQGSTVSCLSRAALIYVMSTTNSTKPMFQSSVAVQKAPANNLHWSWLIRRRRPRLLHPSHVVGPAARALVAFLQLLSNWIVHFLHFGHTLVTSQRKAYANTQRRERKQKPVHMH
jgi:hypothetical protein